MIPYTQQAHILLHQGAIALAQVESNGFALDVPYLEKAIKKTVRKVERLEEELVETDVGKLWKKRFGSEMNLDSAPQLGKILFEDMKFKSVGITKGGQAQTDEDALAIIDHPFVRDYLRTRRLKKAASTYLKGIMREACNGRVHCFFNLNTVVSYRSSCNGPALQTIPIRVPEMMKLVRQAFIPSPGRQLVEIDFSGAEVRVSACYNHDPILINYIQDPTTDMHRDTASELFKLPTNGIPKPVRYVAKSNFVFAQFYGSWYRNCAKRMWQDLVQQQLKLSDGTLVLDHLAKNGIMELGDCSEDARTQPRQGTFEYHVMKVENHFWFDRFKVYAQWKKDFYEAYVQKGWFKTYTGFVCQGYMRRNEAVNYPIQGSSFHCLLWSIIKLILHMMPRMGFKTKIVSQIHDSIVADVVPEELEDFIALVMKVTTKLLPREYQDWMTVPMAVEVEVCPVGAPWSEKQAYKLN